MNQTPTPGAASELLKCPFCAEIDIVLSTDVESSQSDAICTRCGATAPAAAWNHRAGTPAPVMEGSQREAVALPERFERCRRVTDEISSAWDDGWNACLDEFAKLNPPPADRVRPERGEAEQKRTITIARLRGITKHLRECPAYANLQGDADWIDEAADFIQNMLIEQYAAPAPPTDASGGVTDAMAVALCKSLGWIHEPQFGYLARAHKALEAALEAADRARKPVDASAQADGQQAQPE